MKNSNERRPGGKSEAAESFGGDEVQSTTDHSPLAQMKRRREAALRLPPLATGYRDPQFGRRADGRDVA